MKKSRIDIIGSNGNTGEHYMYGKECHGCGRIIPMEDLEEGSTYCAGCREPKSWLEVIDTTDKEDDESV